MDIFKFLNQTAPTKMEQGEIVNGFRSKMWIERYREAGDFTLIASVESGVREKLPLGTFISHPDTNEIMIVENHQISESRRKESEVTITGRGFESFLENRTVSSNRVFPTTLGSTDYDLPSDYTWLQAKYLLEQHLLPVNLIDDDDTIPYVIIRNEVTGSGILLLRSVKRGDDLYSALLGVLEIEDLGIKVVRPSVGEENTSFVIHRGVDRSASVVFSYETGEIETADYLWSNKRKKTSALVSGKWVELRVEDASITGYNRRMMYVDATDVDEYLTEPPTGGDLTSVTTRLQQRGIAALAAQKALVLAKAEVSKENTKAVYRQDFNVGDLIMVSGDYNETSKMRVSEFVEIEDERGMSAYPTLTINE